MRKQIIHSFLFCLVIVAALGAIVMDMMAFTINLDATVDGMYEMAQHATPRTGDGLEVTYYSIRNPGREVQSALSLGKTFTLEEGEGKVSRLTVYVHNEQENRVVAISRPYETGSLLWKVVAPYNIAALVLVCGTGLLLVRFFASRIVRPLVKLNTSLEKEETLPEPDKEELKPLVHKIGAMQEKIQADETLRSADARMQQEFFSNASHELKTPLTSIQGYTELLSTGLMSEDQQKICLESISRESLRMKSLIQDILTVSQLESGSQKSFCTVFPIKPEAEEILQNLQPQAQKKNVTVSMQCQDLDVYAFKKHVHSILENLIENAIKYNKDNGSVTVKIGRQQENVRIFVSDTGIGMSEESKEKMFDRFYRADKQRGPEIPGTGLGMAIVKEAITHYKGSVHVESELGEGTIIEVLLPILVENEDEQVQSNPV